MSYFFNAVDSQVKTPEGGWLRFIGEWLAKDGNQEIFNAYDQFQDEIASMNKERSELARKLHALDNRQNWLLGLRYVGYGLATLRSRRGTLCIYKYDETSPTGVSLLTSVEDTDEARKEASQFGIIYQGAI